MLARSLLPLLALAASSTALTYKGHDLSSVPIMEDTEGATFYNAAGSAEAVEDILGAGGMNAVRLRYVTQFMEDIRPSANKAFQ